MEELLSSYNEEEDESNLEFVGPLAEEQSEPPQKKQKVLKEPINFKKGNWLQNVKYN